MKRNLRYLIAGLFVFALVSLACGISIPGREVIDSAATSVAGTVNALAGTAGAMVTDLPILVITTETPVEELPTLPPADGEAPLRVSFASPDGKLYTWTEGMGSPLLLASDGDICCSFVSPDGTMIAFTRYDIDYNFISFEVINADGTGRFTLLDAAGMSAFPIPDFARGAEPGQIAWVPDSHTLAMNVRMLFIGPGLAFTDTLYLIDAETGAMHSLLNAGYESWAFYYSPDGSKIAVSSPNQIEMFAADGSVIRDQVLYYSSVNTASEYAWVAMPTWSTDSQSLAVGVPPMEPWDTSSGTSDIHWFTYDATSSNIPIGFVMPALAAETVDFTSDFNGTPRDSKFLYITRFGDPSDNVYTLNVGYFDGSPSVEYVNGYFMYPPVWSPDNTRFFYTEGSGNTQYPYIGQVGADPLAITDYTNAAATQWIDDNRYLTVSNNGGVSRLLLGTIGAPTGLIFDAQTMSSNFLTFSVNR